MTEKKVSVANLLAKQPQVVNNTPLDNFFKTFDNEFISTINNYSLTNNIKSTSLYSCAKCSDNNEFVKKLLSYFNELYKIIKETKTKNDLLPVSLNDLKYIDDLISLIVTHGIDANIDKPHQIPLIDKNMSSLKNGNESLDRFIVPNCHSKNNTTLIYVLKKLFEFFTTDTEDDYLKSSLLKGPLYTNTLVGMVSLFLTSNDSQMNIRIDILESVQDTYALFEIYNFLLRTIPNKLMKDFILEKLSTLPLRRSNGIISLVEFVVGIREDEQINIEKLTRVNQILMSKPRNFSNIKYLSELFKQIIHGLSLLDRPVLISCLNNLLVEFYNRNSKIVEDFLFKPINNLHFNISEKSISSIELNNHINVLLSLSKNSSTEFITSFINSYNKAQFFLNLWIYCSYLNKNQNLLFTSTSNNSVKGSDYFEVILSLIQSFLLISNSYEIIENISLNLVKLEHSTWKYSIDLESKMAKIIIKDNVKVMEELKLAKQNEDNSIIMTEFLNDIDLSIELFIRLLKLVDNEEISKQIFFTVIRRWVKNTTEQSNEHNGMNMNLTDNNSAIVLMDLKLLERLNMEYKDTVANNVTDMLQLIEKLLSINDHGSSIENKTQNLDVEDSDDENSDDENPKNEDLERISPESNKNLNASVPILLELLSTILITSSNSELFIHKNKLQRIKDKLIQMNYSAAKEQADKITALLDQDGNTDVVNISLTKISQEKKDQEILNQAMINLNDVLIPIKAHGLLKLRELVERQSMVVSILRVIQLHVQALRNQDPYVYLNAIKGLSSLCGLYPDATISKMVEIYEKQILPVDDILKIGEVLVSYIRKENELFTGKYADLIISSCLRKVRRREARNEKHYDNRIRMSAMSIMGVALQMNALGVQNHISHMLDCAFGILQLETSKEPRSNSFMMRRSAIHLIHDLIYSTGISLFPPQYPVAKTITLLEYTTSTDTDALVIEQAKQLLSILQEHVLTI
ncbi:hypothetical protein TBLA_0G01560 [Henningerozyma blattae CBS 6284]|uniref:RNA polymerase II assembly factor Rtp1 C-terminal domain-containing protein n=1 Tax=Henningerozyma blattae (strain ATCC 34711 / CBS 6284 / DSM 70876 / NBRC 10599 / NRRL Y-10934 / UCD 77-7) TaxID=1071380 RepID=I2H6U8_HENB6|nr:hypothetical protein TBLA_0G01560 [Tetrapisispora blattae CBS 6284]CCH62100.1 hypothetical protein TBLA_0G01560 [Tetrapisispora blattae CBS 6284]